MTKTLLFPLTFSLLFFFTFSFAQPAFEDITNIPDSLKLKTSDELNLIIKAHIFKTKTAEDAIIYINTLFERAERENSIIDMVRVNYYYNIISQSQGNYKIGTTYINKALDIAYKHNFEDRILVFLYRQAGVTYFRLGDFETSLRYYVKELKIAKRVKDYKRELSLLRNIALLKLDVGDKKDAYRVLQINLKICDSLAKVGYPRALEERIGTMIALGKNYTLFGQLDTALKTCLDAHELSKDTFLIENTYLKAGIGNILTLQGKYTEALPYLEMSEKRADSLNIKDLQVFIYMHKGNALLGLKKYKKAIQELIKVDSMIAREKFNFVELQERYPILAKCYDALGDYKKSKESYEKFIALDVKNDNFKLDIVSTIYELYDIDFLEAKIEDLSQKTTHQNDRLSTTKIIISVLCIAILVLFLIFQYRSRTNKRKFSALVTRLNKYKEKEQSSISSIKSIKKVDRKKLISEEKAQELLVKLQKLEQQEVFLDQNCTIAWLAKKMNTNATYASIIINDYKQKKFPEYLSELRIDYATKRLKEDAKFRMFTIKSISAEVGYKSSEAFSKAFKKINGIYPSYFIKMLNSKS